MRKYKREEVFRDPIYGYVSIKYPFIKELIDTSVFQRLRRIRQLSGVCMIFHGAEHSRFTHSLGVYQLANRFILIPKINAELKTIRNKLLVLTAALLHDIGHGPYSHAFESIFLVNHEKIGANIIRSNQEITNILDRIDVEFKNDVASIIAKEHKFPLIEQLISSQLDVDRLDYLERDSYHTGAAYGHVDIDRLTRVITVHKGKIVFKESGIYAIENYLISRYHMYWQVYYHPKARAYETILEKIYLRIKDLIQFNYDFKIDIDPLKAILLNPHDLDNYYLIDDYYMNGLIAHLSNAKDHILRELCHDFLNRRIWSYLDYNQANKKKIHAIKNYYNDNQKYYTSTSKVEQSAYKLNPEDLAQEIMILKKNNTVVPLSGYSAIIDGLVSTSIKEDNKFIYKKIENER